MLTIFLVFLLALILALFLTPPVRRLAIRLGALDRPVSRSVHTHPIPRLGGLAMVGAFLLPLVLTQGFADETVRGVVAGTLVLVVLGWLDDTRGLKPGVKFLGQTLAAVLLVALGTSIDWVTDPWHGGMFFLGAWGYPLTVFWVVAIINVVNLIDGLDGLAAGISAIAATTLMVVAWQQGQALAAVMAAGLAGSALGFLRYNFNPARIFMGDTGSMFLGFVLAAISVDGALKSTAALALAVPVLALGLPIFDTFFAIVRRYLNGQPIYLPDKGHLHHRLLDLGLTQRQAVLVMYSIAALLGLSAVLITRTNLTQSLAFLFTLTGSLLIGAKKVGVLEVHQGHAIKK